MPSHPYHFLLESYLIGSIPYVEEDYRSKLCPIWTTECLRKLQCFG